jgi:hypothetical protein
VFGVIAVGSLVALALLWHPMHRTAAAARDVIMVVLWISAAVALVEAIGGAGYDRFNAGRRISWLTWLHGRAPCSAGWSSLPFRPRSSSWHGSSSLGSGEDERCEPRRYAVTKTAGDAAGAQLLHSWGRRQRVFSSADDINLTTAWRNEAITGETPRSLPVLSTRRRREHCKNPNAAGQATG